MTDFPPYPPLIIGELYWCIDSDLIVDPVTDRFKFKITKFPVMLTEYGENGEPIFLGKDGLKNYKVVFAEESEVDDIINTNKKSQEQIEKLGKQLDALRLKIPDFVETLVGE